MSTREVAAVLETLLPLARISFERASAAFYGRNYAACCEQVGIAAARLHKARAVLLSLAR